MQIRPPRIIQVWFVLLTWLVVLSPTSPSQAVHNGCEARQTLEQSHPASLEHMGQSIAVGGDFNGDGIKDIVIGGHDRLDLGYTLTDGYGNAVTRIFVFLGTGNSPSSGQPLFRHRLTLIGKGLQPAAPTPGHMDMFGYSIAFIGGFDESPCDGIVVGAPAFNGPNGTEAGRVWIFMGNQSLSPGDAFNPGSDEVAADDWMPQLQIDGPTDHGWFGESVATAKGSDGSFLHHLLIGEPGKGPVTAEEAIEGKVYLFEGPMLEDAAALAGSTSSVVIRANPSSGTPGLAGPFSTPPYYVATANRMLQGDNPGDEFGYAVSFVGDIDDDSTQEFLVGAPQYSGELPDFVTTGPGYARLFRMSSSTPLITISGTQSPDEHGTTGEAFGFAVAGGFDLDGDSGNTPDLIIGAPLFNASFGDMGREMVRAGRVRVFAGDAAAQGNESKIFGDVAPNETLLVGGSGADEFGHAVAGVRDMQDDGFDDVLVGAWEQAKADSTCASGRTSLAGAASLFSLGESSDGVPVVVFYGEAFKDHMGRAVAAGQLFGTSSKSDVVLSGFAWSPVAGQPHAPDEIGRGYVWDGDSLLTGDP